MNEQTSLDINQEADHPEQLIIEHIDIWTSAILAKSTSGRGSSKKYELYGITKLRELILELAVRGKLVPQDTDDEPASVLLEKVAAEKAQLIKEKVIKKTKPLPLISNNEKAFELPQGWQRVRLNEVLNIFNGNSINARLKESKYSNVTNGLPYVGTKDVGYGFETLNYDNGIIIPYEEPKFRVAKAGSVLICAEGGSAGKKCGITDRDICFGNKLYANEVFHKDLKPEFILMNFLSPTFFSQFSDSMTGIIGGISMAKFSHLVIAIPPKEEQQRIVAKVGNLMLLCDQLEQQTGDSVDAHSTLVEVLLATLTESINSDELKQNWKRIAEYFDILFTTKQSIEELAKAILDMAIKGLLTDNLDIKVVPLEKVLSFGPKNGYSPREVDYSSEAKVLSLGATSTGSLLLEKSKSFDKEIAADSHLWLTKDDILIQRGNSAEYVGSNLLIHEDIPGFIYPDLMMKIQADSCIHPKYLSIVLSSPTSRRFMWERMVGTSGTMPKINQKTVESVPVPLPTLEEQSQIVAKVGELMAICDQLKEKLQ
ncbi:restriction endonuclease subunit S [Psychrobacter aquaticus]|uniref:Type I restriction-modification system, specificity subunit S n=1 Tax=Psychrobacter aquaticus CMS 56 TaxID=1354303 RepID=U4TBM5_9GAMM|nr:restriction endonuclease subunit S [Psychrobacter aquaticus]ERL55888.1 Type I restriction-modification system, specificity subunit S [Psychrobacter aquaticus CMS 56]